jgi:hypothetical protein
MKSLTSAPRRLACPYCRPYAEGLLKVQTQVTGNLKTTSRDRPKYTAKGELSTDKPRSPAHRRLLTAIDKRTRLGRRIVELEKLYTLSTPSAELTPLRRTMIAEAAQLVGLAELVRGRFMREGEVTRARLSEVLTLERRAAAAVEGLGLQDGPAPEPTGLQEYLGAKPTVVIRQVGDAPEADE